jgi:hypothetical protein
MDEECHHLHQSTMVDLGNYLQEIVRAYHY